MEGDSFSSPQRQYDGDVLEPEFEGDKRTKYSGHFSQWGPSRPRHASYGPPSSTPRPRSRTKRNRAAYRKCVCHPVSLITTFTLVIASLFGLAGALVALSFYGNGDFSSHEMENITFGPGDTQNFFFSSVLCEKLAVKSDTLYSSNYLYSYLYILKEQSSLTGKTDITFEDKFTIFDRTKQRNFHFYPNSIISFRVCSDNSTYTGYGTFYLIKSQEAYDKWMNAGEDSVPDFVESLQVEHYCANGHQEFTYNVTEEDQYYLVFANLKHINPFPSTLVVSYNIQRTVYNIDQDSVADKCRFLTTPCSVSVPLLRSAMAVLVYGEPENWEDNWENMPLEVQCSPRIWLYVVTGGAGTLVIVLSLCCFCLCCYVASRLASRTPDSAATPLLRSSLLEDSDSPDRNGQHQEMRNPSQDNSVRPTSPRTASRNAENHPPPSFRQSDKFSMGSPTVETFTRS